MEIFYTNQNVWWSNEGNDFLEKSVFDNYFNWTPIGNHKSINWTNHYTANFYATNNFNATYFKVVKNNFTYYFFVDDIEFDSSNGYKYYLRMDFYHTYTMLFVEKMKVENPLIYFKRAFINDANDYTTPTEYNTVIRKDSALRDVPNNLVEFSKYMLPSNFIKKQDGTYISKFKFIGQSKGYTQSNDPNDVNKDYWYFKNINGGSVDYTYPDVPPRPSDTPGKKYWITLDQIYRNSRLRMKDGSYKYLYVKIKLPDKLFFSINDSDETWLLSNQIGYIPVDMVNFNNQGGLHCNAIDTLLNLPSDYVIGLIATNLSIGEMSYYSTSDVLFINNDVLSNIPFYIFLPNPKTIYKHELIESYLDNNIEKYRYFNIGNYSQSLDNFNINNCSTFPPFYFFPFFKFTINDEYDFYLNDVNENSNRVEINQRIGLQILGNINGYNSLSTYNYLPQFNFESEDKLPFTGSVFTNYLNNNINSINTGIANAKLQKQLQDKFAINSGFIQGASGLISMGLGALSVASKVTPAGWTTGSIDTGSIATGAYHFLSAYNDTQKELAFNQFNLDAKISTTKAQIQDISNKPRAMLDTYADGFSKFDTPPNAITTYELPLNIKRTIFLDYYLNGFVLERTLNFNNYDKRRLFNYILISDTYQYANKYLNFPKAIISNIAKQMDSGIRLWKTTNYNISGEITNARN